MTEENLDIVNENNNLTGETKPRSLIHSTGLWHRIVHIYFFHKVDNTIEFLVHLRAETKDSDPNHWDTRFGGHIRAGETIEQTVIREIKEEVSLNVDFNDLIEGDWRKQHKHPNNEFSKVYYFEFKGDIKDLKFDDGEVQKAKWMSINEVERSIKEESDIWAGSIKEFGEISDFLEKKI